MNILFSILLPTYKCQYLKECIDSILGQTYPNWELIIVNDASPEDIDSVVQSYADERIHYYKNAHNFGAEHLVHQWNYCLSLAQGEYVICMGDDDKLLPLCLATYATLISRYPDVEILHGQTDIIDENGQLIGHTVPRPEFESAMSLLYHRTKNQYNHQYIGDFCYKTEPLKTRGGYYYLPLAWGSDDISAVVASIPHGIANTQEVVFLYRQNRFTISNSKYTLSKIIAVGREAKWKRHFLQEPVTDKQDEIYRLQLKKELCSLTLKKWYNIIVKAFLRK